MKRVARFSVKESRMSGCRHLCGWLLGSAILALSGCAQTPYAQGQAAANNTQAAQLAAQAKQLEEQRKALDADNKELETMLAQQQQQTRLVQDQYAAVREQMSTQLAQSLEKQKSLEQKLETALANAGGNGGGNSAGTSVAKKQGVFSNSSLANKLPNFSAGGIETRVDDGVIRIELPADRLFSAGDARIRLDAVQLIDNVVIEIERNYPQQYIAIEGHTDNEPPQSTVWLNNHQISTARAAAVFDYLAQKSRLRPNQLFIVGHGANHPVVSNATTAGRARNRRVELVIYPERVGN
jgi:flagellar motor protein MotB